MEHELFIGILIGILGLREIQRHRRGLAHIDQHGERFPFDRWGRVCGTVLGFGAVCVGIGQWWQPLSALGWTIAGAAPIMGIPVPCGFPIVNRVRLLMFGRNLFFLALGASFIAHAVGAW